MPSSTPGLAADNLWPLHQNSPVPWNVCVGEVPPWSYLYLLSLVRAKNLTEVLKDSLLYLTPFKLLFFSLCIIVCPCSETSLFFSLSCPFPHPDAGCKSHLSGPCLGLISFPPYHNHSSLHFFFLYNCVLIAPVGRNFMAYTENKFRDFFHFGDFEFQCEPSNYYLRLL